MALTSTSISVQGSIVTNDVFEEIEKRLNPIFDTDNIPAPYENLMLVFFILPQETSLYKQMVDAQKVRRNKLNKAIFLEILIAEEACRKNPKQLVDLLIKKTFLRADEAKSRLNKLGIQWDLQV